MCPEFEVFGFSFPTYGAVSFLGFWLCFALSFSLVKRRGVSPTDFLFTLIAAIAGLVAGSHLLYGLTRTEEIVQVIGNYGTFETFGDFISEVFRYFSGMVFYGGLYGMLFAGVMFAKWRKYPVRDICDIFAVLIPLFHAFGRVGCFFAGCCYGVRWQYGISGRVIVADVREYAKRLPVQLVEASLLLVLFVVLCLLFAKNKCRHNLLFIYLCTYAVLRFVLEFFRGDEIRGIWFGISTSQWISILTILWVSVYLALRKKKNKSEI